MEGTSAWLAIDSVEGGGLTWGHLYLQRRRRGRMDLIPFVESEDSGRLNGLQARDRICKLLQFLYNLAPSST